MVIELCGQEQSVFLEQRIKYLCLDLTLWRIALLEPSNFFLGAVSKALASNKDRVGIAENNGPSLGNPRQAGGGEVI